MVDSAFALDQLHSTREDGRLEEMYRWLQPMGSSYAVLMERMYRLVVHRMARKNGGLDLRITPFPSRKRKKSTTIAFEPLRLQTGTAMLCTETREEEIAAELRTWYETEECAQWYCHLQPFAPVDGIVKLQDGGLAYLQLTQSKQHEMDATLSRLNGIFGDIKPLYIVVCPSQRMAEEVLQRM